MPMAVPVLIGAAVGGGYSIYAGEKSRGLQKRGLIAQALAQDKAKVAAISQQRKSEMAIAEQNQKKPNIAAIMAAAQGGQKSPTMLTGVGGVAQDQLKLGKPTLLGT